MNLNEIAKDIIETIATEYDNGVDFFDAIHEVIDSREEVIYYHQSAEVVRAAFGVEINEAEQYLEDIYGDSIYEGCHSINECNSRLAYAILYTMAVDLHQEEAA